MRKSSEEVAKRIAEIVGEAVQTEKAAKREEYDDYLRRLTPGMKKRKEPETDQEFHSMFPERYDWIMRKRLAARRQIDAIIAREAAEIRKAHIKPLPDEATKVIAEWRSYTPNIDQLTAFMEMYGEYPQAAQIVNKAAKDAGLKFKVVGKADAEIENLTSAGNTAKSIIGSPAYFNGIEGLERDTLNRINGVPTGSILDIFKAPPLMFDETQYAIIDGEAAPVIDGEAVPIVDREGPEPFDVSKIFPATNKE